MHFKFISYVKIFLIKLAYRNNEIRVTKVKKEERKIKYKKIKKEKKYQFKL
jgi:hypothetical protein